MINNNKPEFEESTNLNLKNLSDSKSNLEFFFIRILSQLSEIKTNKLAVKHHIKEILNQEIDLKNQKLFANLVNFKLDLTDKAIENMINKLCGDIILKKIENKLLNYEANLNLQPDQAEQPLDNTNNKKSFSKAPKTIQDMVAAIERIRKLLESYRPRPYQNLSEINTLSEESIKRIIDSLPRENAPNETDEEKLLNNNKPLHLKYQDEEGQV